jgi:Response regulator containing CheY-like receiver, AAA-type ATPase, and DNA-binding domains
MNKQIKIAIIEDDAAINQMYRMKFESEKFDVQVADDGKSGITLVKDFLPHVILLDLKMPEMDGDETLTEIRKHDWGKKIPVIILTNTGKEEAPKSLEKLGVADYILKAEMTPRQVVNKVKEIINS